MAKWYEFTQRETFDRSIYVFADNPQDARRRVLVEGVPDYPPNFPSIEIVGRCQVADQQVAQAMADERGERVG
jgi:hypothetical protein